MKEKITDRSITKFRGSLAYPPEKRLVIYDTDIKGFCAVVRPTGVISFVLRYRRRPDGASREYLIGRVGSIRASAARKIAGDRYGEVRVGIDIQAAKQAATETDARERLQTLRVFFQERYEPFCLSQMRDGKGQAWKIEKYFVREWPDTPLRDLNVFRIQNWRKRKIDEGLSAGGINRPASALKAMLNRAIEWQIIEFNPLSALKPLKEDDRKPARYLKEDEEKALRDALDSREARQREERQNYNSWCGQRDQKKLPELNGTFADYLKPMVLLALNTGMRRGELFNLVVDDVDLEPSKMGCIVVRGTASKSGNSRIIPLTNEARMVLKEWMIQAKPIGLVFQSPVTGKRFSTIKTAWQKLTHSAGIDGFRFHDLRHTFASNLAMKSVDLYVIKELLGHQSIETTQRYAHLAPDYKTSAIEKLNR